MRVAGLDCDFVRAMDAVLEVILDASGKENPTSMLIGAVTRMKGGRWPPFGADHFADFISTWQGA